MTHDHFLNSYSPKSTKTSGGVLPRRYQGTKAGPDTRSLCALFSNTSAFVCVSPPDIMLISSHLIILSFICRLPVTWFGFSLVLSSTSRPHSCSPFCAVCPIVTFWILCFESALYPPPEAKTSVCGIHRIPDALFSRGSADISFYLMAKWQALYGITLPRSTYSPQKKTSEQL